VAARVASKGLARQRPAVARITARQQRIGHTALASGPLPCSLVTFLSCQYLGLVRERVCNRVRQSQGLRSLAKRNACKRRQGHRFAWKTHFRSLLCVPKKRA